jgi:hypothetical protein
MKIYYLFGYYLLHAVLRGQATNWNIMGSIPNEVVRFSN